VFCYILTVQNVVYVLCINFSKHSQRFELSKCSKTHRGLPRKIVVVKLFLKHPVYIYYRINFFLKNLQEWIPTVTVEKLENVGEENCIKIKTEEDCMQLVGTVKCEQEVSVLWC
jgi:hypothetical protein